MKKNIISRGLLYSDIHLSFGSIIEQERWYPPICSILQKIQIICNILKNFLKRLSLPNKFLPNDLVGSFLAAFDRETQKSLEKLLKTAYKQGPYNYTAGFGDYVSGDNESGMINGSDKDYILFEGRFSSFFGNLASFRVWGDHYAGYRFNVSKKVGVKIGTEKGGISLRSVAIAKKLIGSPFGIKKFPEATFVYISTNLLRNVNAESESELQELKKQQLDFLKNVLYANKDIFLCMHDPTALPLDKEFLTFLYVYRKNIAGIFHGHMHAEYARRILWFAYPFYRKLCKDFKVELIPSPTGMFGIGSGFKILHVFNDRTWETIKHKL